MSKKQMNNFNVEDSIDGYKYVVERYVNIDDPLDTSSADRLCICNTRTEAMEFIKSEIDLYVHSFDDDANKPVPVSPYNITELETIIKWKWANNDNLVWFHTYSIYPVKYISK